MKKVWVGFVKITVTKSLFLGGWMNGWVDGWMERSKRPNFILSRNKLILHTRHTPLFWIVAKCFHNFEHSANKLASPVTLQSLKWKQKYNYSFKKQSYRAANITRCKTDNGSFFKIRGVTFLAMYGDNAKSKENGNQENTLVGHFHFEQKLKQYPIKIIIKISYKCDKKWL